MNQFVDGYESHTKTDGLSCEDIETIARDLLNQTDHRPKLGIICGSGLGGLAELVDDKHAFNYSSIPKFPVSTVPGHAGKLIFGTLRDTPVVVMQGRFHTYEGYSQWKVVLPIRVMKLMGVETIIVTNAAGGLNPEYKVGDIMIIKDHIYLPGFAGHNPLIGPNDNRMGKRFVATSSAYNRDLRHIAWDVSKQLNFDHFTREGVYIMSSGPAYETVSEARFMRVVGGDAVGMSTCPEVVAACHCGMKVFGLSLITNKVITDYDVEGEANHEEVLEASKARAQDLQLLVAKMVERMSDSNE